MGIFRKGADIIKEKLKRPEEPTSDAPLGPGTTRHTLVDETIKAVKLTITDGTLDRENVVPRLLNQGSSFEQFTSVSLSEDKDKILKIGDIPPGLLVTNECADLPAMKEGFTVQPNGYIYGVGAGNIFSLSLLFDQDSLPKAILSTDILPEAVLGGRIIADLMRSSDSYESFVNNLQARPMFGISARRVLEFETASEVMAIFNRIDLTKLFDLIDRITWRALLEMPKAGIIQTTMTNDVISVFAAISKNWKMLKQLADEYNIGFGLADFSRPSILNHLKSLPSFASSRNLIYPSNLIDYINISPNQKSSDPRWESFKDMLKPLNDAKNVFVFTSIEKGLNLYTAQGIPQSAPTGFWLV